jgi:Rrf2 family protein
MALLRTATSHHPAAAAAERLYDGGPMKLTRASDYALHALAYLAAQGGERPVPSHIVAEAQGIPERFLLKVLKPLVSAGVLRSVKGPNGGYRLARSAKDVTILEVVEAVDGPIQGSAPLSEGRKSDRLDGRLSQVCEEAAQLVRRQLARVRVAELVKK